MRSLLLGIIFLTYNTFISGQVLHEYKGQPPITNNEGQIAFSAVYSPSGRMLATDVTYKGIFRDYIKFTSKEGLHQFHMDEVHPQIFDYLNIDKNKVYEEERKRRTAEAQHREEIKKRRKEAYDDKAEKMLRREGVWTGDVDESIALLKDKRRREEKKRLALESQRREEVKIRRRQEESARLQKLLRSEGVWTGDLDESVALLEDKRRREELEERRVNALEEKAHQERLQTLMLEQESFDRQQREDEALRLQKKNIQLQEEALRIQEDAVREMRKQNDIQERIIRY